MRFMVAILFFVLSNIAFSSSYLLYNGKNYTEEYSEFVEKVKSNEIEQGTELVFLNEDGNKSFLFIKKFGCGKTHLIVHVRETHSTQNEWALRIPLDKDNVEQRYELSSMVSSIELFQQYPNVSQYIVGSNLEESNPNSYLLFEPLDISFTFEEFDLYSDKIGKKAFKYLIDQLKCFISAFHQFAIINDLHADNIGFVNGKWMIIDFSSSMIFDSEKSNPEIHILKKVSLFKIGFLHAKLAKISKKVRKKISKGKNLIIPNKKPGLKVSNELQEFADLVRSSRELSD